MPLGYLVVAAHQLHAPLPELEALVDSYGIEISCAGLPRNLTFDGALELMKSYDGDAYLERNSSLSLHLLIEKASEQRTSIRQVVDWLRELGIQIPDLGDTLRAALARVPRAPR